MSRAFKIPTATYRLQMRREFPLEAASGVVPYLRLLGISELYLSPLHAARAGSVHGYDVVDHARLNPELGDALALRQFLDHARASGLGVILDIVPNHMCIAGDANPKWMDILQDGRDSPNAGHFDIDWEPPKPELVGKVLLPFLGDQWGRVLETDLRVGFADGRFFVTWNQQQLPLALGTWHHVLGPALEELRAQTPSAASPERVSDGVPAAQSAMPSSEAAPESPAIIELESIVRALSSTLPPLAKAGAARRTEYLNEKEAIRHRLATLVAASPAVNAALDAAIARLNGVPNNPSSFDGLERLMDEQHYRLAHWRVAAHEVNYRRFFDINELAAVRVEDPEVFATVHALPFEIAAHPAFTGFRIDHVDGLADPEQYLADLSRTWRERRADGDNAAAGRSDRSDAGEPDAARPFVVVEKILGPAETLPSGWQADGTTGYDFTSLVADVLLRPQGSARLRAVAAPFGGQTVGFGDIAYESKRLVLQTTLAAELTVLARHLDRISEQHRYTRDFTLNHLQEALGRIVACFPVYRTYIRRDDAEVSDRDAAIVGKAVAEARRRSPIINASLFDFIESVLLNREPPGLTPAQIQERRTFVTRLQQLTGPVLAKGIEDTAFYRYLPLLALNEVGGNPERFGATDAETHESLLKRHLRAPHSLSATATHDSKRGEDTRARLYVLSEVADAWALVTAQWSGLVAEHRHTVDGAPAPDAAEEYLLYQTLVGTWPLGGWDSAPDYPDRIRAYMAKARHEAKVRTSWINPNPAYDDAAESFVNAVLDPERSAAFLSSVDAFVRTIGKPGLCNSLAQVVLKVAAPGVPDFFQGTELWDFSLVDPDNRRLIDFGLRRARLTGLFADFEARNAAAVESWFAAPEDGAIKLWVTAAALRLRRARQRVFEQGAYQPLAVRGPAAAHAFAFARTDGDDAVIAVVGRFFATLGATRDAASGAAQPFGGAWADTTLALPPGPLSQRRFRDVLTGQIIEPNGDALSLPAILRHLPAALLEVAR